jgi:hypothetical protein
MSAAQLAMLAQPPSPPHPECTTVRHAWISCFEQDARYQECGRENTERQRMHMCRRTRMQTWMLTALSVSDRMQRIVRGRI